MTDNTTPPVPPIPPVPEAGTPAPVEPQPEVPTGGEYTTPPAADPYSQPAQPAAYPSAPPAYGAAPDANPYAQQPPAYGQQPPAYGQPSGYPAQSAPYAYGTGYAAVPPKGMSIASLICGIGGLVTISFGIGFFAAIAAIILGFIAKKNQPYAKGFWLTGIILGFATVALSIIGVVFFVVYLGWASTYYGSDYTSY